MGIRKWSKSKPAKPTKGKGVGGKFLNGVTYAGTKVGQWTVKPSLKVYDMTTGKKKKR